MWGVMSDRRLEIAMIILRAYEEQLVNGDPQGFQKTITAAGDSFCSASDYEGLRLLSDAVIGELCAISAAKGVS